jgi:hypothetical protein
MGGVDSATAETVSEPTSNDINALRERAARLGLTVRGRKNFVLHDGKVREACGGFANLISRIKWHEAIARGDTTYIEAPCGAYRTEWLNDQIETSFYAERQDDGSYKRIHGSKTDLQTGETIQFDILEDGTQQETRRLPKEAATRSDENDEDGGTLILAARIHDEHRAAVGALKQGVLHAIAAGDLLLKAKAQLKHGGWLDWLKANCEIPERTVQAYMRLARLPVEKRNAVADLPLREALSAICSRQERLERAEEAENRPPPGPARICTVGPDGEVLFGEAVLAAIPQESTPPRPATEDEIADELIQQLVWAWLSAGISAEALRSAFDRRFPKAAKQKMPRHEDGAL